jgi:heptosyltransferase-2
MRILVLKTGALGDVLRTTALLPGLARKHPDARVTWLTAHAAADLLRGNARVAEVVTVDPHSGAELAAARERLARTRWDWIWSFDDEEALCALASALPCARLTGALLAGGRPAYTDDAAAWFDMGLISRHGKAAADRLKVENRETHPALFARMLGLEPGQPELLVPEPVLARARAFAAEHGLARAEGACTIGLNTGAGGRWLSKQLSVERTLALARAVADGLAARDPARDRARAPVFLVLGGPPERERNDALLAGLARLGLAAVDAGCENPLLDFAAKVSLCDVLVTSDSLALHVALARGVRVVCFFAPTSARSSSTGAARRSRARPPTPARTGPTRTTRP